MASQFTVELSMPEPPAEAQARVAAVLTDPARSVGLRLTKRGPTELSYGPRVQFPFLLMLWSYINGERMTVKFEPREGGGSRVTISGGVGRSKHGLAADPEHWSEALGAAPDQ
jgi:hypothetical protein